MCDPEHFSGRGDTNRVALQYLRATLLRRNTEVTRIDRQRSRSDGWTQKTGWEDSVYKRPRFSWLLTHLVRLREGAHAEAHAAQQLTHPAETMTERELIRRLDKTQTHTYLPSVFCHPNVLIAETTRDKPVFCHKHMAFKWQVCPGKKFDLTFCFYRL